MAAQVRGWSWMCCRRVSVAILRNWHPLEAPFGPIGILRQLPWQFLFSLTHFLNFHPLLPSTNTLRCILFPHPPSNCCRATKKKKKKKRLRYAFTRKAKKKGRGQKTERIFTCSGSLHSRMGPMDRFGSTWRTSINQSQPATGKLISGLFLGLESTGPNRACGSTSTGVSQT